MVKDSKFEPTKLNIITIIIIITFKIIITNQPINNKLELLRKMRMTGSVLESIVYPLIDVFLIFNFIIK